MTPSRTARAGAPSHWAPLVTFVLFAMGLIATGLFVFSAQRDSLIAQSESQVRTVGELRLEQIRQWLGMIRATANQFGQGSKLVDGYIAWQATGDRDPARAEAIMNRLQTIQKAYGYNRITFFDLQGNPRLGNVQDPRMEEHRGDALRAIREGRPILVDFHQHDIDSMEAMVGVMTPMRPGNPATPTPVGALFFAVPARESLFPMMRHWPIPSASGETLLMRREGGAMRLLFASREQTGNGLESLVQDRPGLQAYPAGGALDGMLQDAVDFRGQPVLAFSSPVPDTPWILTAKQNRGEVEAQVNELARTTALIIALLLAAAGFAFWLWWRNQVHRQQALLLGKELERRVLERHFDFLSRYANEAILLLDLRGVILQVNDRVQDMYGYAREELLGQSFALFHPAEGQSAQDVLISRVLAQGQSRVEAEHQRRDGSRFPVEISARRFQVEGVERLHVIIRDISERRRDEAQLRMQALVLDQIQDKVTVTDLAGVITYVNQAEFRELGLAREELVGRHVSSFGDDPQADASQDEIVCTTLERGHWSGKVINLNNSGEPRVVELRTSLVRDNAGQPCYLVSLGTDITERLQAEQALRDREARYRTVVEGSADGFLVSDESGRILEANETYCQSSGYSHDELLTMKVSDLEIQESSAEIAQRIQALKIQGNLLFESMHRTRQGRPWQVEVNLSHAPIEGGRVFAFIRDLQRRNRADALLRARIKLSDQAMTGSLDELMQAALDAAELFTGSVIGFFHFIDQDQERLQLQAWSTNTLKNMCSAEGKGLHYPISQAGVWADCVRERRVLMHNDYATLPCRKGMPEGHATVIRELVVPILRDDKVVAVLGVGNKSDDYDGNDVDAVTQIAYLVMDLVARKRAEADLARTNERLLEAQRMARMGNWEYDIDADRAIWSAQIYDILGLAPGTPPPGFAGHRALIHPEDFPIFEAGVMRAMESGEPYQQEIRVLRPDGALRHIWHTGRAIRDASGQITTLVGTVQDISERRLAEARLELATHFDVLTGLPNARLMLEKIDRAIHGAGPESSAVGLLLLNIDRFAQLNETLGRAAGDQVLFEAARRWRDGLPKTCQVGRLDADQFIVLAETGEDERSIMEIASALNGALREPIHVDKEGRMVTLTASIGIALHPADARDAAALLHAAEDAMRRAKAEKGGQVRFFDREHARAAIDWFETEAALRQALERDEFFLLYQPQVETGNGRAVAAEALIRWRRDGQVVPPAQFIQVVEGTDLAEPVSRWVLRQACRQARIWKDRQHPLRVAVNIFSDHVTSGHLLDDVCAALEESGLPPELLELEVLESSLLKDPESAARNLREIKRRGVRLALDDFGTGYSSLGYLKHYPFDVLKIDQIFTRNVTRDPEDAAIVRSTISLAHNLGMEVLAEGVETEPQLRFMARYGCDHVQGYLLSRPVNPEAVETLAMERRDLRPRGAGEERPYHSILIVEDEALEAERLSLILEDEGFRAFTAEDLESAMAIMGRERIDLIMADHYLARTTGVEILERMLHLFPDVPRVMASGSTDHQVVMDAVNRAGIRAYLAKPVLPESLITTLRNILREVRHA